MHLLFKPFFELGFQLHPTQSILTDSVSCSILQIFKHCNSRNLDWEMQSVTRDLSDQC